MQIYPSILTESTAVVQEEIDIAASEGDIETVQIDIIDGEFIDNLTISPIDLIGVDFKDLTVDFHLMVNEPVEYVFECKQIEQVRSVIGQIERMSSQKEFIHEARELHIRPGLSIDLYTPVESIDEESWEEIELIQVMGNRAGIQGQPFKGQVVLEKIKEIVKIKKTLDLRKIEILVDIGVNPDTIHSIAKAGATAVTPGSAIWESDDPAQVIQTLRSVDSD
jgi:ribulose-phosphate 3-epimerase